MYKAIDGTIKNTFKIGRLVKATFTSTLLTADRILSAPNKSGTIALLDDTVIEWTQNTAYTIGQVRTYKNNLYICIVNHTSGTSFPTNYVTNQYWYPLGFPVGGLALHENNLVLRGFQRCNGTAISRTDFDVLFALKGTATPYGAGNGTTTFNVPNITATVNAGGANRLYYYVKV